MVGLKTCSWRKLEQAGAIPSPLDTQIRYPRERIADIYDAHSKRYSKVFSVCQVRATVGWNSSLTLTVSQLELFRFL